MKRVGLVVFLVLVCAFAASAVLSAGLANADWPKSRRDAGNRGRSPATAAAKPIIDWQADTYGHDVTMSVGTMQGPIVDANNVYTLDEGMGPNAYTMAFKRTDGSWVWTGKDSTGGYVMMAPIWYWNRSGLTLLNDGTSNFVLVGPGSSSDWAGGAGAGSLWWLNAVTGLQPDASYAFTGFVGPDYYYVSYDAPAVGADGTVYETMSQFDPNTDGYAYSGGTIYAIDPATRALKWSWGADGTVSGGASLGFHSGPLCVATVGGKNVVIFSGNVNAGDPTANVYAIQDDGTSCTVLWSKRVPPALWATPALSNDGQTVYVTTEQWQSTNNVTLFAFDVATGTQKWSINPHAELCSSPAIGADGTIYLTSTCLQGDARTDNSGKLIAVRDNGSSATIKWTMVVDYESDSYFSSPVVNSGTPPTVYFGSTSGRTYAVQDLGTDYKIIWSKALPGVGTHYWPIPVIANDGRVYIHQGEFLYGFQPGYTGPIGITGTVTDAGGTPIANALVSASTGDFPLTDAGTKRYAKTDPHGRYVITVPAGTYKVAAWIDGRVSSDPATVTLATDSSTAAADFALRTAGPNLSIGKTATASSGSGAGNVIDGNINTRWVSSGGAPQWLMVDLGSDKAIGEAVMKWESAWATSYSIQYLKDGSDPAVEANWTNAVFSTTTGAGGIAVNWITWNPKGTASTFASIAKWAPVSARYWRIKVTASRYTDVVSMYELELRSGMPPGPVSGKCADVRKLNNGDDVILEGKRVTATPGAGLPNGVVYVEDAERTGAIRVKANLPTGANAIGTGDVVKVSGTVATTAAGEKYVDGGVTKTGTAIVLDPLGMNNRDASEPNAQGLFVKIWGKVASVGSDRFVISDGSNVPVTVMCGALNKPAVNDVVRVRGVMSKDSSGPALLMRDEQVDWISAASEFQPLPLPGAFKYPQEWLVLGPFADASSGDRDYRLDHDFIADADSGLTEFTLAQLAPPYPGRAVGSKTWTRVTGSGGHVVFATADGQANNSTFYAHVWIYSPVDQQVAVRVGSDDSSKFILSNSIWLDVFGSGVAFYRTDPAVGRAEQWGQDLSNSTWLATGWNSILIKCENGTGASGADIQFVSSDNPGSPGWGGATPIQGLGYLLSNPTL